LTPDTAWRPLYPFTSRELILDGEPATGALRYHYLDEGQGRPLLLVHGNPTWSFHWRNVVLGLRDTYRLVVPDHIGCGLSDKPWPYPYRLAQHTENLVRLIESLDLRGITLLAHDWGGAIGLGAAVRMPERFARFVLFNTAAFRSHRMPWRIRICRTPILGRLLVQGLNGFLRAALHMATTKPRDWLTAEVRAGYLAPYGDWRSRVAIHQFVQDIPLSPRHPSYGELVAIEAGLAQFRNHPVQLIWGMRDWCFTPHFLERFLEFFPAAEVHRLADAGHWVAEDGREEVIPLVRRFLESHAVL
jgi:haloalkane dehalogenase